MEHIVPEKKKKTIYKKKKEGFGLNRFLSFSPVNRRHLVSGSNIGGLALQFNG